jgi:hypothetical protein
MQEDYKDIIMAIRNQEETEMDERDGTHETEQPKNKDKFIEEPLEQSM